MTRSFIFKSSEDGYDFAGGETGGIFQDDRPTDTGDNISYHERFAFDGISNLTTNKCSRITASWNRAEHARWPPIKYNVYYNTCHPALNGTKCTTDLLSRTHMGNNTDYYVTVRAENDSSTPYEDSNTIELNVSCRVYSQIYFDGARSRSNTIRYFCNGQILPKGTYTIASQGWCKKWEIPSDPNTTNCANIGQACYVTACADFLKILAFNNSNRCAVIDRYYKHNLEDICVNRSLSSQWGYGHFTMDGDASIGIFVCDAPLWDNDGNTTVTLWSGTITDPVLE